jgi:cysteine desulfurase / selenocysteine lyase
MEHTITPDLLEQIRRDAPSLENMTFMLSCGASIMPQPVVRTLQDYLKLEVDIGGYGAADLRKGELASVYRSVAKLVHAAPSEIALVENATVAWQMAFYSMRFRPGDQILTAEAEYAANYVAFLQAKARYGVEIKVVPSSPSGETDPAAVERMVSDRVKLIAITWVPTNGGLTNPAAEIGAVANRHGIPYLLDACQAAGQIPIDVESLKCDFLTATSRKFLRGPRGVGFLYARTEAMRGLEPYAIDHFGAPWTSLEAYTVREDARRFETWESNPGLHLALGAAVEYAMAIGLEAIEDRCAMLSDRLREGLRHIAGIELLDLGKRPSAIVSFSHQALSASQLVSACSERGVIIGTSGRASTRIDAERRGLADVARAAPHYFNTVEEVDRTISVVENIVRTHA